jgi:succinate dehydrogenase/fumarate reductase flavoprotein subunit
MKINTIYPDDRTFAKVLERFRKFADERGVPHEDAMIEAMQMWMGADATMWVTNEEWEELAPELERIRARTRRALDSESSDKEPER